MICSKKFNSVMRDTSDVAMEHFSWAFCKAPIYLSLVVSATKLSKKPVICTIAGMLANFQNPKMCFVQEVISLLLKCGHAGSQVHYMVTMEHPFSTLLLQSLIWQGAPKHSPTPCSAHDERDDHDDRHAHTEKKHTCTMAA